ncbi:hypothetical protein RvY_07819-2 [Ramazzottius varieornatus]|uniref:Uncharacterized protein n=1 Tax=Ramazzottius varieornatus TaxID=947166 RepID=A0A1D1V8J2_RAMVA|nr:hypothetical protein RvY_07819-2 [Ramazzottius varieornatus]
MDCDLVVASRFETDSRIGKMEYSQQYGRRFVLQLILLMVMMSNFLRPVSTENPPVSPANSLISISILKRLIFLKLRNDSHTNPIPVFFPADPTSKNAENPAENAVEEVTEDSTALPDGSVETSTLISLMKEVVRAAQSNATDATKAQSLFSEALPRLRSFLQANNGSQTDSISQLISQVSPIISFLIGKTNTTSNSTLGSGLSDFSNRTARGWGGGCGGGCGCGGGYMIPIPVNNNQDNTLQTLLPLLFGLIALLIMKLPT